MSTPVKKIRPRFDPGIRIGLVPTLLSKIAKDEDVSVRFLLKGIEANTIVVPFSKSRMKNWSKSFKPVGIGKGLRTKINANIGTSPDCADLKEELKKLKVCEEAGADTVMDLSTGGDIDEVRKSIRSESNLPVGTVPIYQATIEAQKKNKSFVELSPKEILQVFEKHIKDGVDFITVHCGINKKGLESLSRVQRLTGVVSRGGSLIIEWMVYQRKENPLYEYYDELLEIAKEEGVILSLGDGLRPGSLKDATDEPQISELLTIGDLVARAREKRVQVMVEGPGHIPLNEIKANVELAKKICNGAPLYVLGPLVTDIACGYDHITSAIGGALASFYGADFLCYVTPREHLGLPTVDDVRVGVIASRIAAHAGDIGKGIRNTRVWDDEVSRARAKLDWQTMISHSIYPKEAERIFQSSKSLDDACTMCGAYCALKKSREALRQLREMKCKSRKL